MKLSINNIILSLALTGVAACSNITTNNAAVSAVQTSLLPSSVQYPNGITHSPDGTIFVGSVVSGNIWRKRQNSAFELAYTETPSRFAGTALRYDPLTKYLWVASPDFLGREINGKTVKRPHRIAVIDTNTGTEIWSSEMPDGGFGNDFALDGQGGVFLTDSSLDKIWHIPSKESEFVEVVQGDLLQPGSLGPAGIAFFPDGKLVTGLFSDGELLVMDLDEDNKAKSIEKLNLERKIQNPDGLYALPNNHLLIIEGAVDSGNGKLLHVDLNGPEPLTISVLADRIDSPLNLTVFDDDVMISEGRVRHLMLPDKDIAVPTDFSVLSVSLPEKYSRPQLMLPGGTHPESIAASHDKYLYAGSAVTGEIFRTHMGTGQTGVFVTPDLDIMMSVQGLMVSDEQGVLYACTADLGKHNSQRKLPSKLISFDLSSGRYLDHWTLPDSGLCNDISEFDGDKLLISDTANSHVLIFDPSANGALQVWLDNPSLGGAQFNGNGIVWDKEAQAVFVTTFQKGELLRVNLSEDQSPQSVDVLQLPRRLDGADALRLLSPNELLLFENGLSTGGNGQISRVIVKGDHAELEMITDKIASPTSGIVLNDNIYVPNSFFRTLFVDGRITRKPSEIRRVSLD